MKIYVASSWRNLLQQGVVGTLRAAGHEVYDFKKPRAVDRPVGALTGFTWAEIDPNWKRWTAEQHVAALQHPRAIAGFESDMRALRECDCCILVLPCTGRAAPPHLELGWAVGAGKKTYVLELEPQEPELMYAMCDGIFTSWDKLLDVFVPPD